MTIARIFGIPVRVDWSWLLVFAFFVFALSGTAGPFGENAAQARVALAAVTVLVLFACVVLHEAAHALAARSQGIATEQISLFAFGGVSRLESTGATPAQQARIAAAGPIASLALAALFGALALLVSESETALRAFVYLAGINVALAVFNLLPCNPLDGGRIVNALVWAVTRSRERAVRATAASSMVVGAIIMGAGVFLFFAGAIVNGIWITFLAWFILQAARAEWTSEMLTSSLALRTCADLMDPPGDSVDPSVTCAYALERMIAARRRTLPVASGDQLAGLVTLSDFHKIGKDDASAVAVWAIMTPLASLKTLAPGTEAIEAFKGLASAGYHQLPVVEGGNRLRGFITRETLLRVLAFAEERRDARLESVR